jgi:hypothetical protein
VRCEGALLYYHAQHQVKSEAQLLALLDKNPEGIYMVDLKDAYKQCVAHLRVRPRPSPDLPTRLGCFDWVSLSARSTSSGLTVAQPLCCEAAPPYSDLSDANAGGR